MKICPFENMVYYIEIKEIWSEWRYDNTEQQVYCQISTKRLQFTCTCM